MSSVQDTKITHEKLSTSASKSVKQAQDGIPALLTRVVIIGAGFGGLQAAKALRDAPVQVTVIDRNNHHLFQPLLYWVATAGLSPADICSPIRQILRKQKNTEVMLAEVTGIDVQEQKVLMHERSLKYDYLVVATGAHDNYFGHTNWEQFAPGLKSVVDALAIRRKILLAFEAAEIETDPEKVQELLTFVLVGAGPTGVEMAGAIAELSRKTLASDFRHIDPTLARIILIEAAPRILATFPASLARKTQRKLTHMGVEVRVGTPVSEIDEHGVVAGGERIATNTIIWSAGVSASPAGQWLDAEVLPSESADAKHVILSDSEGPGHTSGGADAHFQGTGSHIEVDRAGRVKVSSDLSLLSHPNVFVIGDTASVIQDGKPLPGVAPVAMQEGRYVASVIADRVSGKDKKKAFRYRDKGNLATVGRSYAIVDIGIIRLTGLIAWFMWLVVHIYYLVGFRNRFVALFQWAWTYFTYHRGARLITFDDKSNNLR